VYFCSEKYKQLALPNAFLNDVRVQFSDQFKYFSLSLNASLKDEGGIQRQVKSLCCAASKPRGTFAQCSPAVKILLSRAYCMPMYASQLWS